MAGIRPKRKLELRCQKSKVTLWNPVKNHWKHGIPNNFVSCRHEIEMIKLFISHASEDKDEFVRPLAEALSSESGYQVWYDEYTLKWGDSLRASIDKGLAECDYAIVVLSHNFFRKKWPQAELDALYNLEMGRSKLILPVWKDISDEEIRGYSPLLAERLAIRSDFEVSRIVLELKNLVQSTQRAVEVERNKHLVLFKDRLSQKKEQEDSKKFIRSPQSVELVSNYAARLIKEFNVQLGSVLPDIMQGNFEVIQNASPHVGGYFIFKRRARIYTCYKNNVINNCKEAVLHFSLDSWEDDDYPGEYNAVFEKTFSPYIDRHMNVLWFDESASNFSPFDQEQTINCAIESIAYSLTQLSIDL